MGMALGNRSVVCWYAFLIYMRENAFYSFHDVYCVKGE